jgi:hypothetical protein
MMIGGFKWLVRRIREHRISLVIAPDQSGECAEAAACFQQLVAWWALYILVSPALLSLLEPLADISAYIELKQTLQLTC